MPDIKHTLHTVFPSLSDTAIDRLAANATVNAYPPNRLIIHQDAIEHTFFILLDGSVDIYQCVNDRRYYLDRLVPYTWFGELALLLDMPRTADVVAAEPIQVLEISRSEFEEYVHSNPEVVLAITKEIIKKFLRQEKRLMLRLSDTHTGDLPRLFISYSRRDAAFAARLVLDLQRYGFGVWIDTHDITPGTIWEDELSKALNDTDIMLLILSDHSVKSPEVRAEWAQFLGSRKPVIPLLLEDGIDIPFRLKTIQHMDFVRIEYEFALPQLVKALQTLAQNRDA